ncbi:MAG TPA: transglutaminaseTgpA domain-containing protein [Propionibacteriaceae bacterium]|nr:transglutaminaseTgpA domain-containing protein [Propionibacteriaceae bacterium]
MRASDRSAIAVTISVMLACFTVIPLTSDRSFIVLSWVLIIAIGATSLGLRRIRLTNSAVLSAQIAILLCYSLGLSLTLTSATSDLTMRWFEHYPSLWAQGIEHMRTQASPMEADDGVKLIFVTVIGIIMIMTDLLVSGIGRPAWAIAPPATLFLVPALGLGTDTGVVSFCYIAVGYLAILVAEGLNSTARWTRGLSRDSAEGFGTAMPVVWRAAGYLAVPAIIATIVLGFALPTLSLPGFGFGNGPGGNGPLQLTDPTLDLRRNLNQPEDRDVIQYQSTAPDGAPGGVYLRLASLPQLSANGWSNVEIRLNNGQDLPAIPGLSSEPDERRTTTIRVLDFGSQYLPLPYAPRTFDAQGDWRHDANSLIVVNAGRRAQDLRRLTYTVESVDIEPDSSDLNNAVAGTPADAAVTADIPSDLPDSLIQFTNRITADADTPAAKAAAIQAYLRSSQFTYSTEPLPGSGYEALQNFLLRDRRGYCEQFASAMAMMARVVGIPSRVSVGFLPGELEQDAWRVSIRDMHAWPELYFANYGWVRFEPTPASVTGSAPAWTIPTEDSAGSDPSADPSSEPTAGEESPGAVPSTGPTEQPTDLGQGAGAAWERTLITAGIALVVLAILAAPATIRVRRRSGRLNGSGPAEEQVEGAWAEIRDTVVDYGGSWPEGSPRVIGREVADRLEAEESESMSRVATLVERSRYARSFDHGGAMSELPTMTSEIRRGVAAPAGWQYKIMAALLPRSLFRRRQKVRPK